LQNQWEEKDTYSGHRREFKERLLDASVVVNVDRVFEHEVDEVGVGLDELVELLQILQLASLLLVENVEVVFGGVELHVFDLRHQVCLLLANFLIALLQLFLLFLERSDFLVNLFLHHLVEVLLLNLELLHNPSKGLFEPINFVVELLAHFEF
jgi:hypothetical protein